MSLMGPRKDAGALMQRMVDAALKDGVRLDPDAVAERAARALLQKVGLFK